MALDRVVPDRVTPIFGLMTKLWLGIPVIIFSLFLLENTTNLPQFFRAVVFMVIYLTSIGYLSLIHQDPNKKLHLQSVDSFWMRDIDKQKLMWIPIGIVGVFGAVAFAVVINLPILGIGLAGIIMMYTFFRTNAILIPILIHGTYNSIIVAIQQGLIHLSFVSDFGSVLGVPNIGITISGLSNFYSEAIWQYVLVATAEELLKMAILVFIVIGFKNRFQGGKPAYIGGAVAVLFWVILHTVQSISI